ncbi:MAG: nitrogenase cofactor biosynthesis protein NifB, partial [Gammaproteobacteria bacterium]
MTNSKANNVISISKSSKAENCGGCSEQNDDKSVDKHPCYSASAQHQYARLHLPVAPACNMQCNYCNRKFDCSNESRPGVVSCLLTPDEGVERVEQVSAKLDNLAVVGIAGPGDPLANPEKTFRTIDLLNKKFPDLITCLSTNGLNLNLHADEIISLGAKHITVTMNTIDPFVSKQIYDWIYFNGKKYTGIEAGEVLLQEQLEGIRKIVASGARVKINSVLIPGINDQDIPNVSKVIKELGVELHNIMPLISKPEFDTHFSRIGQREPTYEELTELRDTCGVDMKMMRHCRQCRADAVGLLGEDRSGCFSKKTKKISGSFDGYPEPVVPEKKKEPVAKQFKKSMRVA